jgi:flavin-dependent dehydrogenase
MSVIADAIVIGAGPAGSAAALELANAGLRVALLERTRFESRRVGEVLAPDVARPLHQLGVWNRFTSDGHHPAQGILSSWGDAEPRCRDFFCHPFGSGWTVDRRRFDASLAEAAADEGAHVFLGTAARRCVRERGAWNVEATCDGGTRGFIARHVVHATGRARGLRSGVRTRLDRLTASLCLLTRRRPDAESEPRVIVEACQDGWWYSAHLPGDTVVAALMTDVDLLPHDRAGAAAYVAQRLAETSLTKWWLRSWKPERPIHRVAADSCWSPIGGEDWIAAGDAVMSTDPLSGDGVVSALDSGRMAAAAILERERGDGAALARCMAAFRERFVAYQLRRIERYRLEQRWASSPFWARRHARVSQAESRDDAGPSA